FFFFFQAEDGIRDRNVTGVQTCALPIFRPSSDRWSAFSDSARLCRMALLAFSKSRFPMSPRARSMRVVAFVVSAPSSAAVRTRRSEERRVGKECSGGGWEDEYEEDGRR